MSNLFGLPVSNATRFESSTFCGQSARNWGRNDGSMAGSIAPFPTLVKLYVLYLKDWQAEVPMVCPPVRNDKKKMLGYVEVFDETQK